MEDFKVINVLKTKWGEFRKGDIVLISRSQDIAYKGRISFIDKLSLTLDSSTKYQQLLYKIDYESIRKIVLVYD